MTEREELEKIINDLMPKEAEALDLIRTTNSDSQRSGAINYLVGKVMQKTRGSADPTLTLELIREKI